MNLEEYLKNLAKNWRNVLIIIFILIVATACLTLIQPLKYSSSTQILVVQNYSEAIDSYNSAKSTQYLSGILAEITQSTLFFNDVMESGFNIKDDFSKNEQKRKKQWQKTVNSKTISDTGIVSINVYHENKYQAEQIARAVSYILKTKHNKYHGRGDNVSVRIIDQPIISNWPVKPNIAVNLILSIIFGLIAGASFVYIYPNYKIKLFKFKKIKKTENKTENFESLKTENFNNKNDLFVGEENIIESGSMNNVVNKTEKN